MAGFGTAIVIVHNAIEPSWPAGVYCTGQQPCFERVECTMYKLIHPSLNPCPPCGLIECITMEELVAKVEGYRPAPTPYQGSPDATPNQCGGESRKICNT